MNTRTNRRTFLKTNSATVLAGTLPISLVEFAFAKPANNFTFAYIPMPTSSTSRARHSCATGTAG